MGQFDMDSSRHSSACLALHLKQCPSCAASIEKNGGCNMMTCRCGHSFNWLDVPTTVPCDCVNPHPQFGVWGSTCTNPSWKAFAKLTAQRTGVVVVGAVATPFILVGGVVVLMGRGIQQLARRHLPKSVVSKKEAREQAWERLRKAEALVLSAEAELRAEKSKWFNHTAIDFATKTVATRRAWLRHCEQDPALESEIDTSVVAQSGCWECSLACFRVKP